LEPHAIQGADIICTTTSAREPILHGEWIEAGAHINAVGACVRAFRELDTEAIAGARLFVDRLESALNESGDILIPIDEGAIDKDHILGEIGDVLLGRCEGRRSEEEVTVFKSLGIGVEDLAAAAFINRKAIEANVGVCVDFGGLRNEAG
jgi:ornithine cyclodeaminase